MGRLPKLGLISAGVCFVLDQLLKWIVTGPLGMTEFSPKKELLPIFQLEVVHNPGVSLGFLRADSATTTWLLVGLTGLIAAAVIWWMWRERNRQDQIALGLIAGGALGNITDRVRLGWVVDYANLHFDTWSPFLTFNLADAAITVGVLILLARALLVRDKTKAGPETESDVAPSEVENSNA